MDLHRAVKKNDLNAVTRLLEQPDGAARLNALDRRGLSPLMVAAARTPGTAMLQLLLAHGADLHQESQPPFAELGRDTALSLALADGDPDKVALLLAQGAKLRYRKPHGYNALLNALHGRDITRDPRLVPLLELLVAKGVDVDAESDYKETALRVLSHVGRFDAVRLLVNAGADRSQLRFAPLHEAVALGTLADVEACLAGGADAEARDWWSRTPWLLALLSGDVARAERLLEAGVDTGARGRCGQPPLHYAIESRAPAMIAWLLDRGEDANSRNEFGETALILAVARDDAAACRQLLAAKATLEDEYCGDTALGHARSREVALQLLAAGANPGRLTNESRRALLGLPPDADADLLDVSADDFRRGRTRRFGRQNPEEIHEPFWQAMIRAGITGYAAAQLFEQEVPRNNEPVWCAQRFGQSLTLLPDGRIVLVGGEHEDYYDPDFCIYNDVFVHEPDGTVRIHAYPEAVFPPTDSHSVTLAGPYLWLIGRIGYYGTRRYGHTPVYRLDIRSWRMEEVQTTGDMPGWIYRHRATLMGEHEIRVEGGTVVLQQDGEESHVGNSACHVLDLRTLCWRKDS
ncbi:MAG: Ankyrin [Moraxellaceae bacterium]|jgi:ankyrin repeat protein|nr:Ankyrin [Moraxellaceae bacterium]